MTGPRRRHWFRRPWALCLLAAFAGPLSAQEASAPPTPLAKLEKLEPLHSLETQVVEIGPGGKLLGPKNSDWDEFRNKTGGVWRVYLNAKNGLPLLVEGSGIEWVRPGDPENLDLLAARAREFLQDKQHLTGVHPDELVLSPEASGRLDSDRWAITFLRFKGKYYIKDYHLVFYVIRGRMVAFGGSAFGDGAVGQPSIAFSPEAAWAALARYAGPEGPRLHPLESPEGFWVPVPEAQVRGAPAGLEDRRRSSAVLRPAWRFVFSAEGERHPWTALVDQETGEVLSFTPVEQNSRLKGGVFPVPHQVFGAGGGERPGFPFPYTLVWIDGSTQETDEAGRFLPGPPGSVVSTSLIGRYAFIRNVNCGNLLLSGDGQTDLDLGTSPGTNCSYPAPDMPGNTPAARTAYFHSNNTLERVRSWLPDLATLTVRPLWIWVNQGGECAASYDFFNKLADFSMGGPVCNNAGENPGVVVHELGHYIDQYDGYWTGNYTVAYADVMSLLQFRDSCIGRGILVNANCSGYGNYCLECSGVRDMDWNKRLWREPSTVAGWMPACGEHYEVCFSGEHCQSYVAGETIWDLATRDLPGEGWDLPSSWQITDRLWLKSRRGAGGVPYNCSPPRSDGCIINSWYTRMRVMDDGDGNLSNGTVHGQAIARAFSRHGISCGPPEDPFNQNDDCPRVSPPELRVTGTAEGARLEWSPVAGARHYLVLRNRLSCQSGNTLIAEVPAGTLSYLDTGHLDEAPAYYTVQAQMDSPACQSPVSECLPPDLNPGPGAVDFDRTEYGCEATAVLTVHDGNAEGPVLALEVFSSSELLPETVILKRAAPEGWRFSGSLPLHLGPAVLEDGRLAVRHGDRITAHYRDMDDGAGHYKVLRAAEAGLDCAPPVIHSPSVNLRQIALGAVFHWMTNERATTVVHWGDRLPLPHSSSQEEMTSDHLVTVEHLDPCKKYFYSFESADAQGNRSVDDNGGQYYSFETGLYLVDYSGSCHAGQLQLPYNSINCDDPFTVILWDQDLNASPERTEAALVTVSSTTENEPLAVIAVETGPDTSTFTGTVPAARGSPLSGDGILQINPGDTVRAGYADEDDGSGQPRLVTRETASNCRYPELVNLSLDTSHPGTVVVKAEMTRYPAVDLEWGFTPQLGNRASVAYAGQREIYLPGIAECQPFYFRINARDAVGNTITFDDGGRPFAFVAPRWSSVLLMDNFDAADYGNSLAPSSPQWMSRRRDHPLPRSGWHLEGEWQIAPPGHRGSGRKDPAAPYDGQQILGHDLTGLGNHPGDMEPGVSERAVGPPLDGRRRKNLRCSFMVYRQEPGVPADPYDVDYVSQLGIQKADGSICWDSYLTNTGIVASGWWEWVYNISACASGQGEFRLVFLGESPPVPRTWPGTSVDHIVVWDLDQPASEACEAGKGDPALVPLPPGNLDIPLEGRPTR